MKIAFQYAVEGATREIPVRSANRTPHRTTVGNSSVRPWSHRRVLAGASSVALQAAGRVNRESFSRERVEEDSARREGKLVRRSKNRRSGRITRNAEGRASGPKGGVSRARVLTQSRGPAARRPKLPLRETLALLRIIATRRATISDLTDSVRMSRATVYRLLTGCKRDLGMRIDCEARVFKLRDWGLLNRHRVLNKPGP